MNSTNSTTARSALLFAAFLVCTAVASAQPGAGPMALRVPSSTRMLGMANAGLASDDADAVFYNPALLFGARGMSVSMQRYGSFGTAGTVANAVTVGGFNIGVGAQMLDWSALPISYRELTRLGATALSDSGGVPASSAAVVLGIARTVRGHRIGVGVKYVNDRIGLAHDGTIAFDVGMMGPSFGPGRFSFVAQNIGRGLRIGGEEGKLPTRFAAGWGVVRSNFEKFDMGAQTQLSVDLDGFVRPSGGMEIGYVPIEGVAFTARAGLRLPRETDESLATGGLGITVDRISIDYAIEPFRGSRPVSHRLGLRIK